MNGRTSTLRAVNSNEKTILTYGTFDLFHIGHLNLLRKLRRLGTRLIVGVSTDEFNAVKGKRTIIPYEQRAKIVASVKYVDEVFPERNWEQKRADIARFAADVFAMGDDWVGKFDELSDVCEVLYVPRTKDISTTEIKTALIQHASHCRLDVIRASERLHGIRQDVGEVAKESVEAKKVGSHPTIAERVSVTRDEVIYAYRFLLERDPENEAVIRDHLKLPNWMELRKRFINSAEFRARHLPKDFGCIPVHDVDVSISEEDFDRLLKHVQASWEILGREKPHWSVLTQDAYLPQNIDSNMKRFFETGEGGITVLNQAASRAKRALPKDGACVELGCGVGRVTFALARLFRYVTGIDISYSHLSLAESYKKNNHIENVSLVLMDSLKTLEDLPSFDFFYSTIVLQHNPPPLIHRMLRIIFNKLNSGGMAYFQIPVAREGYSFSIDAYLSSIDARKTMEMHIFPQVYLFKLLEEYGLRLLDIQRDNAAGQNFHSLTMLVEKCDRV